jgi:hypothetical protein
MNGYHQTSEQIVAGFLGAMPRELGEAVADWMKHESKLEHEGKAN